MGENISSYNAIHMFRLFLEVSLHSFMKHLFILYRRQKSITEWKYLEYLIVCCDNVRTKIRQSKNLNYTGVVEEKAN